MEKSRKGLLAALIGVISASGAIGSFADEKSVEQSPGLEEVVVTARFREETVQDIGLSVGAMGNEELASKGIVDFDDLAKNIAGLQNLSAGFNQNDISIRGLSNARGPNSPTFQTSTLFSLFYDDVAVNSPGLNQRDFNAFDLNRVEVIRGPQPTLFGEGSVGGTIRYFSNDPDLDGPQVTGQLHGRYEQMSKGDSAYVVENATSLILIPEKLGIRLMGFSREDNGFVDNVTLGQDDVNGFESTGGSMVVLARPTDEFEARLSIYKSTDNILGDYSVAVGSNPEAMEDTAPAVGTTSDDFTLYSMRLKYDFGPVEVTSITGKYRRDQLLSSFSLGNSLFFAPVFPTIDTTAFADRIGNDSSFSQEFRFVSNFDGPLNFTAGLFYQDREFPIESMVGGADYVNVLQRSDGSFTPNLTEVLFDQQSEETSGFVEFTYDATDDLRLTAGVRYIKETIDSELVQDETLNVALIFNPMGGFNTFDPSNPLPVVSAIDTLNAVGVGTKFDFELSKYLPKVGFEYTLSDDMLLYGNVAEGARNGGVNQPVSAFAAAGVRAAALGIDPVTQPTEFGALFADAIAYDEDSVISYDLGLKSTWLDGDLTTNIGLFYTEYDDTQILIIQGAASIVNGPQQDIMGMELEANYQVSDNLSTYFNATILDAEFSEDFDLDPQIQSGNEPINTPTLSYAAGFNYMKPLSDTDWTLLIKGSVQYIGERYTLNANYDFSELDPLTNVGFSVGVESERMSVTAFVRNLFNDIEYTSVAGGLGPSGPLAAGNTINRPRSIGLDFRFRY